MDTEALIAKYDARVPRYTSYPTAPHFAPSVDGAAYAAWLAALPDDAALSLYLHVPFCAQLCWFCGCHTTAVNRIEPLEQYAELLAAEIDLAATAIGRRLAVAHVHWGGGTPTALPPDLLRMVMARLRARFAFRDGAEIAVEVDPRTATEAALDGLAAIGCTRASLGVQDFDPVVQRAVNRVQSFAVTTACADGLRARGIAAVNLDLMYGLPHQTVEGVRRSVDQALDIGPDRVAVFGYAHVPWLKKHQALLPEEHLPGASERWRQLQAAEAAITARGYRAIGLDHYALPEDDLATAAEEQTLRRNFQGYTTDTAPVLLGFGASAIGSLPQGYAQNAASLPEYRDLVRAGTLPVKRGIAVSPDDRMRRDVIEQLMCRGFVDLDETAARHGLSADGLRAAAPALAGLAGDGLVEWDGTRIALRPEGRPLVRNVAVAFDAYYQPEAGRHSRAI